MGELPKFSCGTSHLYGRRLLDPAIQAMTAEYDRDPEYFESLFMLAQINLDQGLWDVAAGKTVVVTREPG